MSASLWVLNRCVAPFLCGFCLAAATTADNPVTVGALVGLSGLFAFLSFELGSRLQARFSRASA